MADIKKKHLREIVVSFRLTPPEAGKLMALARNAKRGFSLATACRAICLMKVKHEVPVPINRNFSPRRKPSADVVELSKCLGQLGKIGSNVNQLAKVANSKGELPQVDKLEQIVLEVDQIKLIISKAINGGEK